MYKVINTILINNKLKISDDSKTKPLQCLGDNFLLKIEIPMNASYRIKPLHTDFYGLTGTPTDTLP